MTPSVTYHDPMDLPRLRPLRLLALAGLTLALISPVPASAATPSTSLTRWASASGFATGTTAGLKATSGAVTLGAGTTRVSYDDPRVTGGAPSSPKGSTPSTSWRCRRRASS